MFVALSEQNGYWQEHRSSGRTGDEVEELSAMETYENQNRYQLCLFLFSNNVDLENNNKSIENHSESSGCTNSCNKFVSSRFANNEMTHDTVVKKVPMPPLSPL